MNTNHILMLSVMIIVAAILSSCGGSGGQESAQAGGQPSLSASADELPPSPPGMPLPAGAIQAECTSAADCAPVPDGCCPCTASGKQKAMSASSAKTYLLEQRSRCAGTVCAQAISNDPSCAKKITCRSGKCTLE